MNTAGRIANYLHQHGGQRTYPLGSEGSLTGRQVRRVRHKMNHRKARAMARKAAAR